MKFCKKCGAQLNENAQFCSKCGCKVEKKEEQKTKKDVKKSNNYTSSFKRLVKEIKVPNKSEKQELKTQKLTGRNKVITLLIGLIIVLLLILVCAILFSNSANDVGRDKSNVEETVTEETIVEESTAEDKELIIEGLLEEAKSSISTADYTEALTKIEEVKLADSQNEVAYLYEADIYLKQNDYLSAISALDKGIEVIGSEKLKNRRSYICSNTVLVETTSEDGASGFYNTYDENGNIIHEELYDSEREPSGWNEYIYNMSGCVISCDFYNRKGDLEKRCEYTYDSSDKLTIVEDYNSKHVKQGWHEYKYDSLGKNTEVIDYTKSNKVGWKTTSEYDSFGRLVRNTGYDSKNRAKSWVDTMYDEKGNVVRMTRYDGNGKIVEWNETIYDENGKPIEFFNYNKKNKVVDSTKYFYNEYGIKTKEVFYNADGEETGYTEFDVAGKKTTEMNPKTGKVWNYKYQYVGDVLSDLNLEETTGTLSFSNAVGYRFLPIQAARCINSVDINATYKVIGETAEYYQTEKGWYIHKKAPGVIYIN